MPRMMGDFCEGFDSVLNIKIYANPEISLNTQWVLKQSAFAKYTISESKHLKLTIPLHDKSLYKNIYPYPNDRLLLTQTKSINFCSKIKI